MTRLANIHAEMRDIFHSSLARIKPQRMVTDNVTVESGALKVKDETIDLNAISRIFVVAIGKAAHPLVKGIDEVLGSRIDQGVVLSNAFFDPLSGKYSCYECSHPLPGKANVDAADAVLEMVESARQDDLVICLISGGGSSIFSRPVNGVSVEEKAAVADLLMLAGAPINELNAVRKHLSSVKGGQLLRKIAPARTLGLYLSDVPNDDLSVIASGPTSADNSTFTDAWNVIEKYRLADKIPASVKEHLLMGIEGNAPETPDEDSEDIKRCTNLLLGRNLDMLRSLETEFRKKGYWTLVEPEHYQGEARKFGESIAAKAESLSLSLSAEKRPYAFICGGETTVNVKGNGLGGRNTEVALSAAIHMKDKQGCFILSAGTDGKDGPTDAAGAIADYTSLNRGEKTGIDAHKLLENNDSYNFFKPLDDLLITGPTGTNLMDISVIVVNDDMTDGD